MRNLLLSKGHFLLRYSNSPVLRLSSVTSTRSLFPSVRHLSVLSNTNQTHILPRSKSQNLPKHFNGISLVASCRSLSSLHHAVPSDGNNMVSEKSDLIIDLTGKTDAEQVQSMINSIGQPLTDVSVSALNIASNYSPIGWCIHFLDFLNTAFPFWGSIALGTLILRLTMFPVVVSAQKTSAKLNAILPEQAILKEKMNQARLIGDTMEFARLANESHTLFKRHNVNPIKSMLAPLTQVPVFLTFFLTLRKMANYPVESLKTGGFLWVTDLSIPDPLFVLPIMTSLTLWVTLEMSFRSGLNPNQTAIFKYGARVIPVLALVFTYNFPAAIMVYWCTNNFLSVIQVALLKQPAVRNFLNIPQISVNPMKLDVNKKSFKKHFKETFENAKINKLIEERKTIDEITFKKAGIGPLKKTFKHDPTRLENKID